MNRPYSTNQKATELQKKNKNKKKNKTKKNNNNNNKKKNNKKKTPNTIGMNVSYSSFFSTSAILSFYMSMNRNHFMMLKGLTSV